MLVISYWSFNAEAGLPSGRNHIVHVDVFDARVGRPVPQAALEPFERVGVAFGGNLYAAVGHVFHPAEDPLACRGGLGEISEANALHTAANHVSPRDYHEYSGIRAGQPGSGDSVGMSMYSSYGRAANGRPTPARPSNVASVPQE